MRKAFILLFILLALFADLKVTLFPYIHWVAWIILIAPFMLKDFFKKGLIFSPFLGIIFTVFLLGCFLSLINIPSYETIVQIIKFITIFITLYYFVHYNTLNWKDIFNIFNLAVIVNSLLLIVGSLGIYPLAQILTSDGRWGTLLAFPGSLVKIGACGFYLNITAMLYLKISNKIRSSILLILSIFIVYMDGSRTGMLLIFITTFCIPIFYFLVNKKNKIKSVVIPFVGCFVFVITLMIMLPFMVNSRIGSSALKLINAGSLANGLDMIDPARYMMLLSALEKISANPFIGTGSFTTVGVYADNSSMVVHNTYLQIWGDYGILGLLGIVSIYFIWLFSIPNIMKRIQIEGSTMDCVIICSSILMLCYVGLNGFFHPYSTELSEWIILIIPLAAYYHFYRKPIV
ncbi:O-antigen ligase family protein [Viridibacillus sp. YIM B01967]|uniref:O-antigen ligase family protein n=1 Tax=Viridibacillus soli TaxID=2798301 RepID=A0ABS1HCK7_9BACL|nr:O-antigen ligase family protein [Viridibacillus soli]MBK3497126.1 O-antigen ligase family protein [Viridibacillus soli]